MVRQTPFGCDQKLEFGLKIVEKSIDGKNVIVLQCNFCVFNGRDTREEADIKRKRIANIHLFCSLFRLEFTEQKHKFFDNKKRSKIHAYVDTTKKSITFDIRNIATVNELIGDLFFKHDFDEDNEESKLISKTTALKLFCPIFDCDDMKEEDGDANEEADQGVQRVGLSFKQTAAVITEHRNRTKNA
ncbi:hypothetical protein MPTK1_5g23870 [Marchantia polymorpha subsp. ruderalis]|uniref:Uncharacterized protein n=1 Tax=Marchantia polymorpha subsp. ruderalis TaxID=1480154 RepID=A0AAF6BLM0_MARPO|nr:hypothetical protein Mp_5g23870 [Marchantia polymorpha subsp. ruderalis]